MTVSDDFLEAARSAMEVFGRSIQWTRFANTYDTSTGVNTRVPTVATVTATDVVQHHRAMASGSVEQTSDSVIYLQAEGLGFTPSIGDVVTIDSTSWTVVQVDPHVALGVSVLFTCYLRRAAP